MEVAESFMNLMQSVKQLLGEPFHEAQSERFTADEVNTVRAGLSDLYPRTICDPEKSRIWSQSWFDQYKLLEQSTESIVSRRQETHKFFMASLTALQASSRLCCGIIHSRWGTAGGEMK